MNDGVADGVAKIVAVDLVSCVAGLDWETGGVADFMTVRVISIGLATTVGGSTLARLTQPINKHAVAISQGIISQYFLSILVIHPYPSFETMSPNGTRSK